MEHFCEKCVSLLSINTTLIDMPTTL